MSFLDPAVALSTRQEAFCRHYTASGNAADAARQAGYAERSARQTGCALLERPYIVERVRRTRMSWRRTERDEAQIVLARLEQAWDAAVASGSAYMMVRVLRFQTEIAGLTQPANRAALWALPGEDEFGEIEAGEALETGTAPGPLAEAVRRGRDRAERALARHCESREALERQEGFDGAAHAGTAERLMAAVEERERLPVSFGSFDAPPRPTTCRRRLPRIAVRGLPSRKRGTTRPRRPANTAPGPPTAGAAAMTAPTTTGPACPSRTPAQGRGNTPGSTSAATPALTEVGDYDEIYDPWAPEEVEERRRSRLEREQRGGDPFDLDGEQDRDDDDEDRDGEFAPGHDIS